MNTPTVLISGASVAGPALAWWLNKYGYQVTIVEQAVTIRPGGHAVDFRGAAVTILRQMELFEEVCKFETRAGKLTVVNKHHQKNVSLPDAFTSGELEILRGDLANVLYEATRQQVEYIFDDTITNLKENNNGVQVSFQKAASRCFDLVFGADGLHSKVRSIAFGDERNYIHHLGLYICIFTIPNFMNQGMDGFYYNTLGKNVGISGTKKGTEAKTSFYFASPPLTYDYRNIDEQKQIIRKKFCGEEWKVPYLLKFMETTPDFYFDSISQVKMKDWSTGRVALVGDAAYCPSSITGMGTSIAFIGAYILAGELKAAHGDHQKAFAAYEAAMRKFVLRCQGMAGGVDWFVPKTKLKRWIRQQFIKLLPYAPFKKRIFEQPTKIAKSIILKQY